MGSRQLVVFRRRPSSPFRYSVWLLKLGITIHRRVSSVLEVAQVPGEYKRWCASSLAGLACQSISLDRVTT